MQERSVAPPGDLPLCVTEGEMKAAGALTKPEALSQGVALPRSGEKPAQPALCGGGLIGV